VTAAAGLTAAALGLDAVLEDDGCAADDTSEDEDPAAGEEEEADEGSHDAV
jgi:hypothetical protein